jgi:hypothetical protein
LMLLLLLLLILLLLWPRAVAAVTA